MVSENVHKELLKLNLGCGLNAPSGWINIDASFTARLSKWKKLYKVVCKVTSTKPIPWPENIKIVDVREGLPFLDGAVQAIFRSHMLEHIDSEGGSFLIKECYRCLATTEVMPVIVPDLYQMAKKYINLISDDPRGEYSHNFLRDLNM